MLCCYINLQISFQFFINHIKIITINLFIYLLNTPTEVKEKGSSTHHLPPIEQLHINITLILLIRNFNVNDSQTFLNI